VLTGKQINVDANGNFEFVPHDDQNSSIGFQIFFTGDLEYQSMILGKVNMASSKCPFCKLRPKEWSIDHEPGELWCLEAMAATRKLCDDGIVEDTADNRQGCVKEPIYNLALWIYIIPLLHCMIGMFNDAMEGFLTWVDERCENIPDDERFARGEMFEAEFGLKVAEADVEVWIASNEQQLECIKGEVECLKEEKEERMDPAPPGWTRNYLPFVLLKPDRDEIDAAIKERIEEIKAMEAAKKEEENLVKALREIYKVAKSTFLQLRKKRGKLGASLRQLVEEIFRKHGVSKESYHGGDYTGVAILEFIQKICLIFDEIEILLASKSTEATASLEEIATYVSSYHRLFVSMDDMFSLARTPSEKLQEQEEQIYARLAKVIGHVKCQWTKLGLSLLGIKSHSMFEHLIEQMRRHRGGIAEYMEDFVELCHRMVKRHVARSKTRDRVKAARAQCQMEELKLNPEVQAQIEKVHRMCSRNLQNPNKELKKAQERKVRVDRRDEIFTEFEDGEDGNEPLQSGMELNRDEFLDELLDEQTA
jgi:uncharacterized coiled-coil DUF342 family protein